MAVTDRIETLIAPELFGLGVDLYDIEMAGESLRILLDVEGGISVSQLRKASRIISAILDEEDPISGAYLLEVSSPGLERRLRTQVHFAGAIGTKATVKLMPTVTGERRIAGLIAAADEETFTVTDEQGTSTKIAYADVSRAKTVFEWGSQDKPGKSKSKKNKKNSTNAAAPTRDDGQHQAKAK